MIKFGSIVLTWLNFTRDKIILDVIFLQYKRPIDPKVTHLQLSL
ncbi:hypothetical protein GCM10007931_14410 [Vibrio algivorus]|uniref:Uncharacterized protein n=1 Tax=Vibrio algivorus TaxID=1667024 RepID=A0ABQ6ENB4_9VIBR|nr:hypothetical protein GCM10007931_14410 [Vibrio algivorus]